MKRILIMSALLVLPLLALSACNDDNKKGQSGATQNFFGSTFAGIFNTDANNEPVAVNSGSVLPESLTDEPR